MKSLIGNKVAEKDIRDWLSKNGYQGKPAKFTEIELHAIQRPDWLQIFRFELRTITAEDRKVQLFGAMLSDERYGPQCAWPIASWKGTQRPGHRGRPAPDR